MSDLITDYVQNWIDNNPRNAISGATFEKPNPATGKTLCKVARSGKDDVELAVASARKAQPGWAKTTPVERGAILRKISILLQERAHEMAQVVHLETGKSVKDALGETGGAVEQGFFMAGEGRRFYGKTTTSAMAERTSMMIRQPVGVAGLIIASNTPIANVAWKVFPALICGNAAILKPSEDTPMTAWAFAQIAKDAGLPDGVLNVIQGLGAEAGAPLVEHPGVDLISFTGSTATGRWIAKTAGERLAKVFLELGGKNPMVVCDDADMENAVKWTALSAFSNAGQRCAAASRVIVFDKVYDTFRAALLKAAQSQKVGSADDDDLGPVINERQLNNMISAVENAKAGGAKILTGGTRLTGGAHAGGYYMAPTLIEGAAPSAEISRKELFGPIACLYRVNGFEEAVAMANDSEYGLTACIHTSSVHRALEFARRVQAGVVNVNAGTYGSEPHMPFGGVKNSGNGLREPGTEALDVYTELKNISVNTIPGLA
ncbi:MAG: aldehyde dehydrogenase [Nitrospinae bacterium]|nr:aldehyde dehydrogenase [Nitrospinota bacterium]